MAIKRCPYCRALISDEDQYCKNCGTQLLFPEDEDLEEEIPGDRIVEDNLEEEEENEEELREEDREEKEQDEEEAELPFKREKTRDLGKPGETHLDKTEEDLVKKIEKEVLSEKEKENEKPSARHPGLVTQIVEELKGKDKQPAEKPEEDKRPGLVTRMVEELGVEEKRAAKEEILESEAEKEPASGGITFESAELDEAGRSVEVGQREVEDFFKVLEEKEKEYLKEKSRIREKGEEGTGGVPSWIKEVKTASTENLIGEEAITAASEPESEKIEVETGEPWREEESSTEPTMGFPEKLTRSQLEFEEKEELTGEAEMELEGELDEKAEAEEADFRETPEVFLGGAADKGLRGRAGNQAIPATGFKTFIKAKIFDLLFLIMFWMISIWLAARSMQTNIFKLMGLASSGLLIYLLILTFFYFFLFYFFIGETLGDRLFREGEEENL